VADLTAVCNQAAAKQRRSFTMKKKNIYGNQMSSNLRDLRCTPFSRAWRATGPAEKYANQPWLRDMAPKYGVMAAFIKKTRKLDTPIPLIF